MASSTTGHITETAAVKPHDRDATGFVDVPATKPALLSPGISSEFDDYSIIDEVNVDLSFPPP